MPPTDGDVAGVTTDGGDSNAALAANSALSVPFSCGFCQRSFPRLSLLKKHEQVPTTLLCFSLKQLFQHYPCFDFNRLTAMRCRSVVTFVLDSLSTNGLGIVTSSFTLVTKSTGVNIAKQPFLEGMHHLIIF